MYSLNLWSGLPTPTLANTTHWFSLLAADQQQEIIRALAAHPNACIIRQRDHIDFLTGRNFAPAGPLHDYINAEFEPAFTLDDFEFCVRRGRRVTPFMVGEILQRAAEAGAAPDRENSLLRLSLLLPPARPIAGLAVTTAPGQPPGLFRLDATNSRVEVTPLSPRGDPIGPARPAAWPLTLGGPCALSLYFDQTRLPRPERAATIVLQDEAGREVGLARLQR
jgi:hypothetical protein